MGWKNAGIELIDIAKAITIVLVIPDHTAGNLEAPMYRRLILCIAASGSVPQMSGITLPDRSSEEWHPASDENFYESPDD